MLGNIRLNILLTGSYIHLANLILGKFVAAIFEIGHHLEKFRSFREIFFHFREVFENCIEYIGNFLIHFREILNFVRKTCIF